MIFRNEARSIHSSPIRSTPPVEASVLGMTLSSESFSRVEAKSWRRVAFIGVVPLLLNPCQTIFESSASRIRAAGVSLRSSPLPATIVNSAEVRAANCRFEPCRRCAAKDRRERPSGLTLHWMLLRTGSCSPGWEGACLPVRRQRFPRRAGTWPAGCRTKHSQYGA